MATTKNSSTKPATKGYGKRPIWQWVVLYLILGGIAYYVIYLVFFHGHAGY